MFRTVRCLLAVAAVAIGLLQPALAGERISSKALGFEITLPDGWVIQSQDQMFDMLDRTSQVKDELLEAWKTQPQTLPLLHANRFPEPYPDYNPNIQIRISPYLKGIPKDIEWIAKNYLSRVLHVTRNSELVTPVKLTELDGLPVAYGQFRATIKTETGELPFMGETWFIPKSEFYMMVVITYRPDGKTGTRDAGATAVQSMKFFRDEL